MTGSRYNGEAGDDLKAEAEGLRQEYRRNGHAAEEPRRLWDNNPTIDRPDPGRRWFMEDWIIRGQCTGVYGVGGVMKTDWLVQAMVAGALGVSFCGFPIAPAPVLGLFCEDDDDEITRRVRRILGFYGRGFGDLGGNCFHNSLIGIEVTEFLDFDLSGRLHLTDAYHTFRMQLGDIKPRLAVLDTAADFFGGNEVDRRQVGQFIRALDCLAREFDCALVFSAHPSIRGIRDGSLQSGSTTWENKVRARLTMHDPGADQDDEDDAAARMLKVVRNPSDRRIITRAKSNYARPGEELRLVLKDGGFFPEAIDEETAPQRGPMHVRAAEAKFLELLGQVKAVGAYVNDSPQTPQRYAPKVFARNPAAGGFTERDFTKAMSRLFGTSRIGIGEGRFGGRPHPTIVIL